MLHTRLRDGSAVSVSRAAIMPLLQGCLERLEDEEANPIVLLCTGEFPELRSQALLIEPDRLLVNLVRALRPRRLGVLVPLPAQIDPAAGKEILASRGIERRMPLRSPEEVETDVKLLLK